MKGRVVTKNSRLVYSTDWGSDKCPFCGHRPCRCPGAKGGPPSRVSLPPEGQTASIRCERKGRGGKTVTVVTGLQLSDKDLADLGQRLRRSCGSGGTVKAGSIEIQGDHRDKVADLLRDEGYRVKMVGG